MPLIKFLKKIVGNKGEIGEKTTMKSLTFDELHDWIEIKEKELEKKEEEIFLIIKDKNNLEIDEIKRKLERLENYDFSKNKAEDVIKNFVKENLANYIRHTKNFVINIENLEKRPLHEFIGRVNEIFSDLDSRSFKNYKKASYLLDREMAQVKESTVNLSKHHKKVFEDNKYLIEERKKFEQLRELLNKSDETKEKIDGTEKNKEKIDKRINEVRTQIEIDIKKIEEIKNSEEYKNQKELKEKIEKLEIDLEKNILSLKDLMDFKVLGDIYHQIGNKHDIIKKHKDNFLEEFKKDKGISIISLVKDSNLSDNYFNKKIDEIQELDKDLIESKKKIKEDPTIDHKRKLSKNETELSGLIKQKSQEEKLKEKFLYEKEDISHELGDLLKDFNVELKI